MHNVPRMHKRSTLLAGGMHARWWTLGATMFVLAAVALAACSGAPSDGAPTPTDSPTPASDTGAPLEELKTLEEELNSTDLAVTLGTTSEVVRRGERLTYEVSVTNHGPNPTNEARVAFMLAAEVAYEGSGDGCQEERTGLVTCVLGALPKDDGVMLNIWGRVRHDVEVSGEAVLISTVNVENLAGSDPTVANNQASAAVTIADPKR